MLSGAALGGFAPVTLTGQPLTLTGILGAFRVVDTRHAGTGWRVVVTATRLRSAAHVLPPGSLRLAVPAWTGAGSGAPGPSGPAGPVAVDGDAATVIARGAPALGPGVYDFAATRLTLTLPAATFAGTYSTTIAVHVVSGP